MLSLASNKYWLSKRNDRAIVSLGYDSIALFGDVKVYKNNYALPLGFTYNKMISESDFKKMSSVQKDFCLLRACVFPDESANDFNTFSKFSLQDTLMPLTMNSYADFVNSLRKETLQISKFTENDIIGNITVSQQKALFFSIPFDKGWKVTLNGTNVKLYRLNCGLTGLIVPKGNHTVELSFTPRYKKLGAIISGIFIIVFIGLLVISNKKNKTVQSV